MFCWIIVNFLHSIQYLENKATILKRFILYPFVVDFYPLVLSTMSLYTTETHDAFTLPTILLDKPFDGKCCLYLITVQCCSWIAPGRFFQWASMYTPVYLNAQKMCCLQAYDLVIIINYNNYSSKCKWKVK